MIIMRVLRKIYTIMGNMFVYILSIIIKKDNGIFIFGSWFGRNFADNSRYLYLYLQKNKERLNLKKVIWITEDDEVYKFLKTNNLDVEKKWSLNSIYYHLKAKYHFICQSPSDINSYFSVGANRIQLWHGVGPKKVTTINKVPNTKSIIYKIKYLLKYFSTAGFWYKYNFLSTSSFVSNKVHKYLFRLWENNYIEANYPRNIYLNLDENRKNEINVFSNYENEIISLINDKKHKFKIILYLPTYRNNAQIDEKTEMDYPLNINSEKDFSLFIDFLHKNNIFFISKLHFAGDKNVIENSNNFYNLNEKLDIYTILNNIDLLITDYSSVYTDFLFIDKPIIFYIYDIDIYKSSDKGFICNFDDITPGDKVYNIYELQDSIINNLNNDLYINQRKNIKEMFFGGNINDTFENFVKKFGIGNNDE